MEFSKVFKSKFNELLVEFARTRKLFNENHDAYFVEKARDGLILTTITPPDDINVDRVNNGVDRYCLNLYRSRLSVNLVSELSRIIQKSLNINCFFWELDSLIEDCAYELISNLLSKIYEGGDIFEHLLVIFDKRMLVFKNNLKKFVFQFPVNAFNGVGEISLTKNIKIIKLNSDELMDKEFENYKQTKFFGCNYYIQIEVVTACSYELSLSLAKRSMNAICNSLNLLSVDLYGRCAPLITSSDSFGHLFEFYRYGEIGSKLESSRTRTFLEPRSKQLWQDLIINKDNPNTIFNAILKIPELLLIPNNSEPLVLELVERSLIWYGEAVSERNELQRVQKIVTAIEALTNFKEENTTETFKLRVMYLNMTSSGFDQSIYKNAGKIYSVRSSIVHGAACKKMIDFDYIKMCSNTLINAILYFQEFGLTRSNFRRTLPNFIDNIVNKVPNVSN
ncbi:HEPN domain-containing protein [Shewanella sp. 10B]|uniref:HEPN domain-containing protein n=1 Tax=Shewanella sp. 10B TaxID=2943322 RepID=UPI00201B1419|nr:HEPN domain-containing protein [Shewanella sp. 10B]